MAAAAAPQPAAEVGQCGWVHGRFAIYNGSSVRRIRIIGTHRTVAMRDDDERIPPEIDRYEQSGPYFDLKDSLSGDFRICARETRRLGHMQHVRVTATRNLIFQGKPF
ncbi:MAG TPA: hypothetical protein VH331_06470 [Allosphingosinicella sp.]|nr:hypothetical protein [Allosphingosinicella sp.]